MESHQFDRLAKSLSGRRPRRAALSLLSVLGFELAERLNEARAAKSGKCKPACGECATCSKGKCKHKHGKTVCKKGRCTPQDNGAVCRGGTCQDGSCVPTPPPVPTCGTGGVCLVFVTSSGHNGNLGGLSGADAICQGAAASAGLPGTYKAWLSDSTNSPSTRFVQSTGPYQLRNGTTIAANWAELTDGTLAAPINITETAGTASGPLASWTNTQANGTVAAAPQHCGNWSNGTAGDSGLFGDVTHSDSGWTQFAGATCNGEFFLYCFQQS